ncbi:DUF3301 domain-containing protein [Methylobacter svalbardensis]|uniref:DUF3301 domain-containing protein n=1 Tax=Methylobacter svalbardensis TaxID=3080016 RepID=UPI0030EE9FF2
MWDNLILIALLLGAYLYWFNGQQVKEIALKAVRAHCLNLEVQMLDEYVALNSIRLDRDQTGKMRVRRAFLFEFSSTGNERYNGACIMLGRRVESIHMEPYRFDEEF